MGNLETYPGLKNNNNKTLLDFNDKSKRFFGSSGKRPKNLQGNEIKLKLEFVKARQLWRKIFFKSENRKCASKISYLDKKMMMYSTIDS